MERLGAHGILVATCLWGIWELASRAGDVLGSGESLAGVALAAQSVAVLAACLCTVACIYRKRPDRLLAFDLRLLAYAALAALVVATLVQAQLGSGQSIPWEVRFRGEASVSRAARSIFFATLMAGAALWAVRLLRRSPEARAPRRRWTRALDVLAMNALVLLLATEVLTTLWARIDPSPLFFTRSVDDWLDSRRPTPGMDWFGWPLSSRGYADDEFFAAGPRDFVTVVLTDSFGLGVVPRPLLFVDLAEGRLRERLGSRFDRVALHNFGVPSIGLPEYARILEEEALETNPALVVLGIFLGNDVHEGNLFGDEKTRERVVLQEWLAWSSWRRALALVTAPAEDLETVASLGRTTAPAAATEPPPLPPHVTDPELEQPTFSESTFLGIEAMRMRVNDREDPEIADAFDRFFAGLDWFRERVGDRLIVLLIPDEFQVNDRLYEDVVTAYPDLRRHDRFGAQARVLDFCQDEGIECVDLLPALRKAEDDERTYHRRDTHLNARGNRVAARVLAEAILERVDPTRSAQGHSPGPAG